VRQCSCVGPQPTDAVFAARYAMCSPNAPTASLRPFWRSTGVAPSSGAPRCTSSRKVRAHTAHHSCRGALLREACASHSTRSSDALARVVSPIHARSAHARPQALHGWLNCCSHHPLTSTLYCFSTAVNATTRQPCRRRTTWLVAFRVRVAPRPVAKRPKGTSQSRRTQKKCPSTLKRAPLFSSWQLRRLGALLLRA
jgi:hypothetical protein